MKKILATLLLEMSVLGDCGKLIGGGGNLLGEVGDLLVMVGTS